MDIINLTGIVEHGPIHHLKDEKKIKNFQKPMDYGPLIGSSPGR